MPLATLDFSALMQQHTDKFIHQNLQFAPLKSACISLAAVPGVLSAVQKELNSLLESDKTTISDRLAIEAFKQQTKQDKKEDSEDQEEAKTDLALYERLNKESVEIQSQIAQRKREILSDENKINALAESLKQVEQLLDILTGGIGQEQKVTIHLPKTSNPPQGAVQTNYQQQDAVQNKIKELQDKKEADLSKTAELKLGISTKEALNRQKLLRLKAINNELEITLHEKQKQRNLRFHARKERATVRSLQADPDCLQLSLYNRLQLQKAIAKEEEQCQGELNKLEKRAAAQSYTIFIERLGALLPYTGLNALEILALGQIRQLMLEYRETRLEEQKQKNIYQAKATNKNELEQKLKQEQDKAALLMDSEPQLNGNNQHLGEDNQRLEGTVATNRKSRNNFLKLTAGSGASTGLASGIGVAVISAKGAAVTLTAISPAIGLGAVTLVLAGTAVVKEYKGYRDRKRINSNLLEITNNKNTLEQNSLQFSSINDTVIPSLEEEIRQLGFILGKAILDIRDLDEKANLILNKAKNINAPSFKGNSFLAERVSPPTYVEIEEAAAVYGSSTSPSAPPFNKVYDIEQQEPKVEYEPVTAGVRF